MAPYRTELRQPPMQRCSERALAPASWQIPHPPAGKARRTPSASWPTSVGSAARMNYLGTSTGPMCQQATSQKCWDTRASMRRSARNLQCLLDAYLSQALGGTSELYFALRSKKPGIAGDILLRSRDLLEIHRSEDTGCDCHTHPCVLVNIDEVRHLDALEEPHVHISKCYREKTQT